MIQGRTVDDQRIMKFLKGYFLFEKYQYINEGVREGGKGYLQHPHDLEPLLFAGGKEWKLALRAVRRNEAESFQICREYPTQVLYKYFSQKKIKK